MMSCMIVSIIASFIFIETFGARMSEDKTTLYVIYPKNSSDVKTNNDTLKSILNLPGIDQSTVIQFGGFHYVPDVVAWQANLTDDMKELVSSLPYVQAVVLGCNNPGANQLLESESTLTPRDFVSKREDDGEHEYANLWRRDVPNLTSYHAKEEMTFLSSYPFNDPRVFDARDYCNNFVYNETAAKGVTVYVMAENDVSLGHSEFESLTQNADGNPFGDRSRIEWLGRDYGFRGDGGDNPWLNPDTLLPHPTNPTLDDHGTGVLSKIVGKTLGAAKNARVVFVRWPQKDNSLSGASKLTLLLIAIRNHWQSRQATSDYKIGVISLSRLVRSGRIANNHDLTRLTEQLTAVMQAGLLPVVTAGNYDPDPSGNRKVEKYPAVLARGETWALDPNKQNKPRVPNLLVIGGVSSSGKIHPYSREDPVIKQYAPFEGWVASYDDTKPTMSIASGNSITAPTVAGVAAYLIGLDDIYKKLLAYRWPRGELDPEKIVENLFNYLTQPAKYKSETSGPLEVQAAWPRTYNLEDPHAIWNGITEKDYEQVCRPFSTSR